MSTFHIYNTVDNSRFDVLHVEQALPNDLFDETLSEQPPYTSSTVLSHNYIDQQNTSKVLNDSSIEPLHHTGSSRIEHGTLHSVHTSNNVSETGNNVQLVIPEDVYLYGSIQIPHNDSTVQTFHLLHSTAYIANQFDAVRRDRKSKQFHALVEALQDDYLLYHNVDTRQSDTTVHHIESAAHDQPSAAHSTLLHDQHVSIISQVCSQSHDNMHDMQLILYDQSMQQSPSNIHNAETVTHTSNGINSSYDACMYYIIYVVYVILILCYYLYCETSCHCFPLYTYICMYTILT
jgi:hypothetical protein